MTDAEVKLAELLKEMATQILTLSAMLTDLNRRVKIIENKNTYADYDPWKSMGVGGQGAGE